MDAEGWSQDQLAVHVQQALRRERKVGRGRGRRGGGGGRRSRLGGAANGVTGLAVQHPGPLGGTSRLGPPPNHPKGSESLRAGLDSPARQGKDVGPPALWSCGGTPPSRGRIAGLPLSKLPVANMQRLSAADILS